MPSASSRLPAGAGASRLQFGGAFLQQSIAQKNEAQRGSPTVRMPWALSKPEREDYDHIFRAWDPTASGFLNGNKRPLPPILDESVDILRDMFLCDMIENGEYNHATNCNRGDHSQSKHKERTLYGNDTHEPRKDETDSQHNAGGDIPVYHSQLRTVD